MLVLATPPTDEVVTLEAAKAHLRVFHDDDDEYIKALVAAAVGLLDGADGYLNRALGTQSWTFSLDRLPWYGIDNSQKWAYGQPKRIYLPLTPLISVDSFEYMASDETSQQLTTFRTFGVGSSQPGYVVPALDASWPSMLNDVEVVRITFTAGYEAGMVPAGIQHAIKLMIGHWYENREAATTSLKGLAEMPLAVNALLTPYRNWRG